MAAQHGDGTATQLRLHGRGGQGTVTAAELLAVAAFEDGLYAQAFPSFGSERMGAPVEAYCRVGSKPIRTREPVARPDVVIVQDPTLLGQVNLFGGLTSSGFVIVNASRPVQELDLDGLMGLIPLTNIVSVPATRIALEHVGRPHAELRAARCFVGVNGSYLPSRHHSRTRAPVRARHRGRQ